MMLSFSLQDGIEQIAHKQDAVATTPNNVAIGRNLRTLRRMIASGNDRALTDIMKANTVPSAAPLPNSVCKMGMILYSVSVLRVFFRGTGCGSVPFRKAFDDGFP